MPKVVNLLGIRKKTILCRIKNMGSFIYTVMRPITEEQEKILDRDEQIDIDGNIINVADNFVIPAMLVLTVVLMSGKVGQPKEEDYE